MDSRQHSKNLTTPSAGATEAGRGLDDNMQSETLIQQLNHPQSLMMEVNMPSQLPPIEDLSQGGLRVLLVDDHDDILAMMNLLMTRRNFSVVTASSGHQALEIAEEFAPHIVVSDIGMPGMDGYELMTTLRASSYGSSIKSIALSGYGLEDDQHRARAAGYDAHLTKPIDFDMLFEMIEQLISPSQQIAVTEDDTESKHNIS